MAISTIGTNSISGLGYGFKNRIINGAMMIDQRNAGASQTITAGATPYTVDRWFAYATGANITSQRVAGSGQFQNAIRFTGATGNTLVQLVQRIEAVNCYDLANQTVTVSFVASASTSTVLTAYYAYPSATDNYASTTYSAGQSVTLTSTPTQYSFQFALPSGVTNGVELILGSNTGLGNAVTMTITGVQLEKGSTATSFDYRPYGTELALCQRYYEKIGGDAAYDIAAAAYTNTDYLYFTVYYRATKRATPTVTKVGTWSTMTAGQPTVIGAGTTSAGMQTIGTTNGRTMVFTSGTTTYVTAEAEL